MQSKRTASRSERNVDIYHNYNRKKQKADLDTQAALHNEYRKYIKTTKMGTENTSKQQKWLLARGTFFV